MIRIFLFALLCCSVWSSAFITPAYPPSAFQNQFYSVRFRIRGVDFPVYKFTGLPKGLKADSDGTISGVPSQSGSFSVKLTYIAGADSGLKEFVLTVTLDSIKPKDSLVTSTQTSKGLVISFPNQLIFKVGQKFNLKLKVDAQPSSPLVWGFLNLPQGISGNSSTGQLEGYLKAAGYYNLNVQVADKNGKSASAFITINAQPSGNLQTSKIVQVQVQNTQSKVDLKSIQNEQIESDNSLSKVINIVNMAKKVVYQSKQKLAVQTVKEQSANDSFTDADRLLNEANEHKRNTETIFKNTQNVLFTGEKNLELYLIQSNSSITNIKQVKDTVDTANNRFSSAQKQMDDAQNRYVDAKYKISYAQTSLRDANTTKQSTLEEYKRAAVDLQVTKQSLQDARKRKQFADLTVRNARDTLQLTIQARDNADIDLKKSDFSLSQVQTKLSSVLLNLSSIRQKYNNANKQYSQQKWQFDLAINKLYIAQARKQTADRSTAIALAQGSLSDHNNEYGLNKLSNLSDFKRDLNISSVFVGCQSSQYPPISGVSQVKSISSKGYILSSGHSLIFGNCSKTQNVKIGEWVSYNGYIVNSIVSAQRIQRVLLN